MQISESKYLEMVVLRHMTITANLAISGAASVRLNCVVILRLHKTKSNLNNENGSNCRKW